MKIKLDKNYILPGAILAGGILLSVTTSLFCQPFVKGIADANKQESLYARETASAYDLLDSKSVFGLLRQLSSGDKVTAVMDAVKKLAEKSNLKLTLLRPPYSSKEEGSMVSRVLFEMQADASLKDMGDFLRSVRNMPEGVIDIRSMRLVPDDAKAGSLTAKITFELLVARNNE